MIIPKVMNSECNAASSTNHHAFVRRNNNNYNFFPTSTYSNHGYDKFVVAKSNNNFIPSLNNNNGVGAPPRGPAGPTYIVRNHQIPHNNHYNNTSSTATTSADQKCTKINSLIAKFSWKDGAHSSGASLYPPPITKVTSTSPTTAAAAELPIICYGSRFNNNFFGSGGDTINDYPTLIKRNTTFRDPSGSSTGSGGGGAIAMSQHHYSKPVYSLSRTDSVSSSKTLISGRGCGNGGGVISPFPAPTCPLLLVNNGATNQKSPTVGVATSTSPQIIEVYDDTKFGLAGLKKKRDEESAAAISHPQQLPIIQQQSSRHPSRDQIDGGCSFTYKYGLSALKDTTITPRNTGPDCPRPGIDSTEFISVTTTTTTTSTKKKQPSISGLIEQYQMKANQLLAGPKTAAPPTPTCPNPTPGGSTQTLSSDTEMINAVTPTPSTYPHPLMPPSPPPYHKSYETTDEPESPFFHNGSSSLDSEEMSSNHPSCCYYEEDEADSQLFTFRTGADEEAGEEPYCKLVGFGKAEESSILCSGSATVANNMAAAATLPPSSSYHGRQCSEDSTTSSFSSLLLIVSTPHHMILNAWQQQQQQNPPDGVMMTPPEPDTAGPRFVHHDVQQILEGCVSPVPLSFSPSSSSASSASSVASFTSSSSSSSSNPNNNNNNTTNGGSLVEEIPPPATGLPLLNSRDVSSPSQDDPTTTYLRLKAASGDSFDFDPPVPNLSRGMPAPDTRSSNHQGNGEAVTTSLPGLTTTSAALKSSSNSIDSLIQQSPVKEIVGGINNNRVVSVRDYELLKSNGSNYRLSSTPAPTPQHNHHPQPKQLSSTNKRGAGWNNTPTSLFSSSPASAHGPRQQRRNASSTNNLLAAAGANNSCSSSVSLGRYHAAALQNQHQVYITRSDSRGSIASLTSLVSLASSTSYLSPHELQHLIEDANQSLDQTGNGAGEYVIQVIILYREHMGGGIGITLAGGIDQEQKEIRIHKVITGSVADKDGRAQKGDRVLSINGKPMHNLTHRQSVEVLKAPRAEVVLVLSRLKDESDVSYLLNNTLGESSLQLPLTNNLRNTHRILLNDNGPFNENDSYESYQLMDQEECLTEIFESSSNPYPERNSVLRLSNSFDSPTNDFLTSDTFTEPLKLNNHKPQQQSLDDMKNPNRTTDNKDVPPKNNSTGSIDLNDMFTDETGLNSKIFELELENQSTCGLGISLEGGKGSLHGDKPITIKRIFKGGTVEKCGVIQVGDEMLKINGETTEGMTHFQAWNFVKSLDEGRVTLTIKTYQHHT